MLDRPAQPGRVLDICKGIAERTLDLAWACRSRVDTASPELLKAMHAAGCRRIYWGVEHGSQEVLDRFKKGVRVERIRETLSLSRRLGMQNLGFFLTGVPGETRRSIGRTVEFAKSLPLDYVQFSKLLAKPGTGLWSDMKRAGWRDYWADWVSGKETDRELPRPWLTEMDGATLDRLTHDAYLRFTLRPVFLLRHLLACRSLGEFRRKASAFIAMVLERAGIGRTGAFRIYRDDAAKTARLRAWAISGEAAGH